jgi:hypothetical protein
MTDDRHLGHDLSTLPLATEEEVIRLWCQRLQECDRAAKGARALQLKGVRKGGSGFDALRGVHLVSEAWGALQQCEAVYPPLMACEADLNSLRAAAEEDALAEFLALNKLGEVLVQAA